MPTVNEQGAGRLKGVTHFLNLCRHDRFPAFKAGDGTPANGGGVGEILLRPIQSRSRHSALTLVHGVSFSTKNT
ncbi:MAG TPA: hypothetical protein VF782_12495 [Allosphingosinicella sp.]|jgi:hypothetical protein